MSYWTFNREVGLKGVEGVLSTVDLCPGGRSVVYTPDPTNPLVLNDDIILYILRTSRTARKDFQRIFPSLLPDEQARLTKLLEENPRISSLVMDDQVWTDNIQKNDVLSIPVRTSGPRGGKGGRPA